MATILPAARRPIVYGEEIRLGDVTIKFHPAGHVLGSAQIAVTCKDTCIVASGDYKDAADPTCTPFEVVPCDVFITEATFGLPVFRHGDAADEVKKLLASVALFPERAHLVGAYSLGKAQRVIALLRAQATTRRSICMARWKRSRTTMKAAASRLASCAPSRAMKKADLAGTITLAPPSATSDIWTRRFPDPVTAFASGWMRVRARARQRGIELPLVISDHADWDGLTATIAATGAGEIWVTHGQEDALVHWCKAAGLAARPLDLVGYGDEEEHEAVAGRRGRGMNRFAELLDRLAYEPGRNNKLRLITAYFRDTPDPDRGYALAALTGALSFKHAKPGLIRDLIMDRTDPVLFGLSYDYVGDLSETVALMWPKAANCAGHNNPPPPTLSESSPRCAPSARPTCPKQLARWLDELDETGRWALLKLVTGAMRIGISARLAKTAAAALGDKDPHEIELMWPGLAPPYLDLFAWLEGRGEKPVNRDPTPFRPVMLAHAIEDADFASLDPADFIAEWKWDGIRVQAVSGRDERGHLQARLYSRTGEDITKSFPDLVPSLHLPGAIDGELLVLREGRVQTFNVLQQRLNRKVVSPKLIKDYPIHLRAYDLLGDDENDLRELPFVERRAQLEAFVEKARRSAHRSVADGCLR